MWRGVSVFLAVAALGVPLALFAGCGGGGGSTAQTASTVTTGSGATPIAGAPTDTPYALTPIPTVTSSIAADGAGSVCTQPGDVQAQPPANMPRYPGADLRASQERGGNGIYVYCAPDPVSAITDFYTRQLPDRGWTNVKVTPISNVKQITATQGGKTLTVTISPDAKQAGTTYILAVVNG